MVKNQLATVVAPRRGGARHCSFSIHGSTSFISQLSQLRLGSNAAVTRSVHQVGPAPDHRMQLAIDDVDLLPQAVEIGRIHEAGGSCARAAILRPAGPRKGKKPQDACANPATSL
jgi:hypothetical protein